EVIGVDLRSPIEPATQRRLQAAFARHRLVLFREQTLTVDEQIRAVATFGPVVDEFGDGTQSSLVSNLDPDAFLPITERLLFHSDRTYTPSPLLGLSLYALDASSDCTPTRYVNLAAAFPRLPPELQRRVVM